MPGPTYYAAFLDLSGRRALVVGAGTIAREKIDGLLLCGARVSVVAPEAGPEVKALAQEGAVTYSPRPYRPSDLDGCFLVVAATSDTAVNTRVYEDAEERAMLVNVVDVPRLCNFILPAIARFGPVAVAVSTSGASPALAKRMKREVAALFGVEYGELAVLLNELRPWAKATLPTYEHRREFFEAIVNGEPDPIVLLRAGDRDGAVALLREAQEEVERESTPS